MTNETTDSNVIQLNRPKPARPQPGVTPPDVMRYLKAWLLWQYVRVPGQKKPRKVPFYTNGNKRTGIQGREEDVAQLVTYDEAVRAADSRGEAWGVGFCPLPGLNITGCDFDECVDENGKVIEEVKRLVAGTYAEYSPSGTGVHAYFLGELPFPYRNKKSFAKDWGWGFETFSTKGFLTFTGRPIQ